MLHRPSAVLLTAILLYTAAVLPALGQQHRSDAFDDLLQHMPMAAVFVLKACSPTNHPQQGEAAPLNPPNWGKAAPPTAPEGASIVLQLMEGPIVSPSGDERGAASPSWRRLEGAGGGWVELTLTALSSYAIGAATAYSLKQIVAERRPDKSDRRSFPSGHAMFAFAGATMLHHEFGNLSPWVTIGGYGIATLTAVDRLVRDRHYLHDVCAGAAIGIAATELTYFLKQKLFKSRNVDLSFTGQRLDLAIRW